MTKPTRVWYGEPAKWTTGGLTHVQYDHGRGPTEVALRCPRCAGEALAKLPLALTGVTVVGDLHPEWDGAHWQVVCTRCTHRAGTFTYDEMRAHAPLYFTLEASGQDLWAWNRDHLKLIVRVLAGADVRGDPYAWLATYIPGHWKARASRYGQLARHLLKT